MTATTTDPAARRRLVDLSVVGLTALTLAASWLGIVRHDAARREAREVAAAAEPAPVAAAAPAAPLTRAPAPGLVPASPARRKVVVVRRSRAS